MAVDLSEALLSGRAGCPECDGGDGMINIGRSHWCYCNKCKVQWCIGSNLFSSWREETVAEQRARYHALGLQDYTIWPDEHPSGRRELTSYPARFNCP